MTTKTRPVINDSESYKSMKHVPKVKVHVCRLTVNVLNVHPSPDTQDQPVLMSVETPGDLVLHTDLALIRRMDLLN